LPNVVGISIGTRSDCISDEILDYLGELSKNYEVWLEFGVQSIFDETLEKINRAHSFENVSSAILAAKQRGLNVCAHLIFGLPDETKEMALKSVEAVCALGADSIKFHPLYVVNNTALANSYKKGEWKPLSEDEYLDILAEAVLMLPETISIQRFSAGDAVLLAPDWCSNKNKQMLAIKQKLAENGLLL
jgi:radical SAM protein (TIGR01212 family)